MSDFESAAAIKARVVAMLQRTIDAVTADDFLSAAVCHGRAESGLAALVDHAAAWTDEDRERMWSGFTGGTP